MSELSKGLLTTTSCPSLPGTIGFSSCSKRKTLYTSVRVRVMFRITESRNHMVNEILTFICVPWHKTWLLLCFFWCSWTSSTHQHLLSLFRSASWSHITFCSAKYNHFRFQIWLNMLMQVTPTPIYTAKAGFEMAATYWTDSLRLCNKLWYASELYNCQSDCIATWT